MISSSSSSIIILLLFIVIIIIVRAGLEAADARRAVQHKAQRLL